MRYGVAGIIIVLREGQQKGGVIERFHPVGHVGVEDQHFPYAEREVPIRSAEAELHLRLPARDAGHTRAPEARLALL